MNMRDFCLTETRYLLADDRARLCFAAIREAGKSASVRTRAAAFESYANALRVLASAADDAAEFYRTSESVGDE